MKQTRLDTALQTYLSEIENLHYEPAHDNLNPQDLKAMEDAIAKKLVDALCENEEETIAFYASDKNLRYTYRLVHLVQSRLHSEALKTRIEQTLNDIKDGKGDYKIMMEQLAFDINDIDD